MHIRETPFGPALIATSGQAAKLTRPEATILVQLMAHRQRTWRELADALWPYGGPDNMGGAVRVYIGRLRNAGVCILNVRGQGYALEGGVERTAA